MSQAQRSLDDILENPGNLPQTEIDRIYNERLLAIAAILLHQQGRTEAAGLLTDVVALCMTYKEKDWGIEYYEGVLEVEPHLVPVFTDAVLAEVLVALQEAIEKDPEKAITEVRARPLLPRVSGDWRQQLKAAVGGKQSNQARRVKLQPKHPMEDGLHFSNEWEHRVYTVLKQQQAGLPDNDTFGILALAGMRVLNHTYEPDLLITYRGRAGVIEIDGPHHKGRRSDDTSRERLLRNAGVKYIDRIDVRDTTTPEEVHKFVTDFLKHLAA
ncbi:hypothetical protein ACH4L7_30090 [Streptomyces anulatus]